MAPSTSSSMCCCMRRGKTKQNEMKDANGGDITIRINGKESLRVPKVLLNGVHPNLEVSQNGQQKHTQNGIQHQAVEKAKSCPEMTSIDMRDVRDEDFITARTHREQEIKHLSMSQLIQDVRVEEGLTERREHTKRRESRLHEQLTTILEAPEQPRKPPHRAIFNEEGDITGRTLTTRTQEERPATTDSRRASIVTISGSVPITVANPPERSVVRRYASATPQFFIATVAVIYSWIAGVITLFGSLVWK